MDQTTLYLQLLGWGLFWTAVCVVIWVSFKDEKKKPVTFEFEEGKTNIPVPVAQSRRPGIKPLLVKWKPSLKINTYHITHSFYQVENTLSPLFFYFNNVSPAF